MKQKSTSIKTLVLTGFGINSDVELAESFTRAGSLSLRLHINDLVENAKLLDEVQILAIPGGFSFGDHLGSGRVLANRLKTRLGEKIHAFIQKDRLVLGICNGFQVIVKMGLLPNLSGEDKQEMTLAGNDSGRFEDRWVRLKSNPHSPGPWLRGIETLSLPVRHGEGKLIAPSVEFFEKVRSQHGDALFYVDEKDSPTQSYPQNPNGSVGAVAGLVSPDGKVFGLMPHPEAFMTRTLQPAWRTEELALSGVAREKLKADDGGGMAIFYNAVAHF
ncbi:MAG: phosphoribosylformylglycinamidine synthase subunit PurQ, partial [Spirochaetia bacterium]|nr:phosphoribosylformylglycinamidine synthase subunit PurQ [Spirochaetia bacterium]